MKDKISIIVAVYNTEKYVKKCIDSILNQTYKNIELIIIEDKSTDNSKKVLSQYAKNSKVKIVYNEENKGLAYSRNVGLDTATGDYIGFIDSDDFIQANYYEVLIESLKKAHADIAVCDMKLIYEDTGNEIVSSCCNGGRDKLSFINNGLAASACNKLFKREIIDSYRFEVGKINEDIPVVIPAMVYANKIIYVDKVFYNYYQRNTSIQNSTFNEKRFDIFFEMDLLSKRIKDNKQYKEIMDIVSYQQLFLFFIYVIPKEKRVFKRAGYYREFRKLAKDCNFLSNKYCLDDMQRRGKKAKFYYSLVYRLNNCGFSLMASFVVFLFSIYSKIKHSNVVSRRLSVIKQNITLNTLVKLANKQSKLNSNIKISVVVPNYNYNEFLYQRIYSILNQDYGIYELIILDDCSTDDSMVTIRKIEKTLQKYIDVKVIYNKTNGGSAFSQWEKGFLESSGDYVWICEADDYCDHRLLSNIVKPIDEDKDIVISYANTTFINKEGVKLFKSIKPEIDIQKSGHWDTNYVNNGIEEIKNYSYLNNTIANVSSCIIKNNDYSKYFSLAKKYKQSGDWIFYTSIMQDGKIAYTDKVLNYYREHGNNISSTTKKELHLKEIESIHDYYVKKYNLSKKHLQKMQERIEFLKDCWKIEK